MKIVFGIISGILFRIKCPAKTWLLMRLVFILLFAFVLAAHARTYSQKISLNRKNVPLKNVLNEIRQETGYSFVWTQKNIVEQHLISVSITEADLQGALNECLKGLPLNYEIRGKVVYIKQTVVNKQAETKLIVPPAIQQNYVHGVVTDSSGKPLEGVSVLLRGTKKGTATNLLGEYRIYANQGDQLSFSYVGYKIKDTIVGGDNEINILLQAEPSNANDLVIVAYGQKQSKIETLGAQSTMDVEDLKQPVANLSTVLAGRISGLVGVQRSGEPGQDNASLFIRGDITQGDNSPLVLVDGVERSFNNLDPDDIASLTILKDASSTAVYGVRGANGVILIQTKKGKVGPTTIDLDYYQGITNFTTLPKLADGVTYMQMANEASTTRGGSPIYTENQIHHTYIQDDPYLYPNVNWMKEIFNKFGHNRKANLSITGGTQKVNYRLSVGYYDETGLFKVDALRQYNSSISYGKYTFSSALSVQATKSTKVDFGVNGWISNGNYPGTGASQIFDAAINTYPILYPTMYPGDKEPYVPNGGGLRSPYALLTNRGYSSTFESQIMSNLRVTQDLGFLVKGLSVYGMYSFDNNNSNSLNRSKSPTTYYATSRDADGNLVYSTILNGTDYLSFSRSSGGERQFYLESAINYSNTFGKHKVTAMALYNQNDLLDATAGDLINSIPHRSLGSVGRLTYAYDERYLAEASFGYNGAETFSPARRFGFFPSYAIGWVLSNEKFYGNADKIFQLIKLRASYGLVGNSNIGGRRFAYLGTVINSGNPYQYAEDRQSNQIYSIDIGDYPVNVSWETEKDLNIGLDLKTLNNDLSIETDAYYRKRSNIFLNRSDLPSYLGINSGILGNIGISSSKGIDITGNYHHTFGKVDFSLQGNFTYYENKWIEDGTPRQPYPWLETRGKPIYVRFGYVAEGFYTQADIDNPSVPKTVGGVVQAGDLKFKDLNGDGVIDANDEKPIGRDQLPQITYGFGTSVGYKGFSLNAFFQGDAAVDFYISNQYMPFRRGSTAGGLYSNIYDRWTPEYPSNNHFYPRLSYGADINQNYSVNNSHFVMNGAFLRLKSLDFGYTFDKDKMSHLHMGIQKLRVYFIGYNLITFSSFKMWDPELGGGSGTTYPNIRTFSLGVNATF